MRCVSAFSGFKFRKAQHRGHKGLQRTTETLNFLFRRPLFSVSCRPSVLSVFSVLNSEKRNTEDAKFHREPQRNRPSFFRRLQLRSREDFFARGELFDAIEARGVADSG